MHRLCINLGHPFSDVTKEFVKDAGYTLVEMAFHVRKIEDLHDWMEAVVQALVIQRQIDGNTDLMLGLPGLSAGSSLLIGMFAGITGNLPKVLNIIRSETWGCFAPDHTHPYFDLQQEKNKARQWRVSPQG